MSSCRRCWAASLPFWTTSLSAEAKRRSYFNNGFKRVLHRPTGDPLQPTETERQHGYVVFCRDFMKDLFYNDTPFKDEIGKPLAAEAFARPVPGQSGGLAGARRGFIGADRVHGMQRHARSGGHPGRPVELHHRHPVVWRRSRCGGWAFCNGGNRWTYGDYLYKAAKQFGMKFRLSWHWNATAGDPYYALDCREDDYAWCNATPDGQFVPAVEFERLR
jgi:hypothetical protein